MNDTPFSTKVKDYAIGGGYAAALVLFLLAVVYLTAAAFVYFEPVKKQAEPVVMTIYPVTQHAKKKTNQATNKIANEAINAPAIADVEDVPEAGFGNIEKEPETQFDRDLINFESKL